MNRDPTIQANKKGRENGLFSCVNRSPPRHMAPVVGALF